MPQQHRQHLERRSQQGLGHNVPRQRHLSPEPRSHRELGHAGLHRHRLCPELRCQQGGSVPQQRHLGLELRSCQGLGNSVLHRHPPCPEPMSHPRLRCHKPHQDCPCQRPPCPELTPHQCPVCHTPHQHHPAPEPMSQQRPRCPMPRQHHPEPRARQQRVPSAVTTSQASPGSAAPHGPGAPRRAVRGCRLSSSPSPCHGLAPVTPGLGRGTGPPGMESSTAGEGGDGDTETLLPNGGPAAVGGWPQPQPRLGRTGSGPSLARGIPCALLCPSSALFSFLLRRCFTEELYLPPTQCPGLPGGWH